MRNGRQRRRQDRNLTIHTTRTGALAMTDARGDDVVLGADYYDDPIPDVGILVAADAALVHSFEAAAAAEAMWS